MSTSGNRCCSSEAVTLSSNSSTAVMFSPAMVPMPLGDGTTSSGVIERPPVTAVAETLRHGPASFVTKFRVWTAMFITP